MKTPIKKRIHTELLIDKRAAFYLIYGECKNKGQSEGGKMFTPKNKDRWK